MVVSASIVMMTTATMLHGYEIIIPIWVSQETIFL